jgi:hypothetical protein
MMIDEGLRSAIYAKVISQTRESLGSPSNRAPIRSGQSADVIRESDG